jgi:hypothetical protein
LNCSTEIAPACDGAGAVAGGVNGAGAGGGVGLPVAHSRRRGTSGCSTGTSCRSTAAGVTWGWASKASAPETVGGTASLSGAIQQRTPHTGRALTDHPEDAFLRAADPRPGRQRNCDPPGTANLSRHASAAARGSPATQAPGPKRAAEGDRWLGLRGMVTAGCRGATPTFRLWLPNHGWSWCCRPACTPAPRRLCITMRLWCPNRPSGTQGIHGRP